MKKLCMDTFNKAKIKYHAQLRFGLAQKRFLIYKHTYLSVLTRPGLFLFFYQILHL